MSGADTYDGLKSVAPDLPVLLASGFSINGEAESLIEKGVRGFIQKPYLSADLKRKIAEALGLS